MKFEPVVCTAKLVKREYFNVKSEHGPARVISADFSVASQLLVVGFHHGVFGIYELPELSCIHTLSISQQRIDSVSISPDGQWLAFASAHLGQLLVWEWQSETYVMKQQGHYFDMNCVAYAPNGASMATGGDDGKVKLWRHDTGFCYVTFAEHGGAVSALAFAGKQGGK